MPVDMEIHRADKAYRSRATAMLALVVVLCGVLLWQLNGWLAGLSRELPASDPDTVRWWLRALFVSLGIAMAVPAAILGANLRAMAYASRLEGRFPPREWKTWRDVRVLRDAPALHWARRVELLGTLALLVAAGFVAWAALAWFRYG